MYHIIRQKKCFLISLRWKKKTEDTNDVTHEYSTNKQGSLDRYNKKDNQYYLIHVRSSHTMSALTSSQMFTLDKQFILVILCIFALFVVPSSGLRRGLSRSTQSKQYFIVVVENHFFCYLFHRSDRSDKWMHARRCYSI